MRNIPINARVECTDGRCGTSTAVVVNPVTRQVTHIGVEDRGGVVRLVPIDQIEATTDDWMRLSCSSQQLEAMDVFVETHFVPPDEAAIDYAWVSEMSTGTYLAPYAIPVSMTYATVDVEHVPEGEMAIHRGATIEATDGYIGRVAELLIDPESGQFTHVVTQEGHLWGKKEIALPLSAIDRYENDTVYLKLSRADVGQLPAIPIKRSSRSGKPATERLELVARVFDDMQGADQALDFLHQLQTQEKGTFKIRNAVVLVKDAAGEVSAREVAEQKETRRGRWLGALAGGLVGLAAGPVGALVGALAGLGAGNLAASKHDAGFSQQFLAGLEEHLQPGTSALVVLAEHEWMRPLSEVWASREEVIFQETLSDEIVRRLLAAQATGTASEEGSPPPAADA